jgi:hypothetical protein
MNLESGENLRKRKKSTNWTFFLFFPFPNFRSDKIGIFLLEEGHLTMKETCLFPEKKKKTTK